MVVRPDGAAEAPGTVARRYPLSDTSLPARYARAISAYRHSDLRQAVAQIDTLISVQPGNPYFYELKGQALLEGGRPAEAIAAARAPSGPGCTGEGRTDPPPSPSVSVTAAQQMAQLPATKLVRPSWKPPQQLGYCVLSQGYIYITQEVERLYTGHSMAKQLPPAPIAVRRVLAKLGAARRAEIAAWIARRRAGRTK